MTPASNQPVAAATESSAAKDLNKVPVWLFIVLFLLLYWGLVYFDTQGGWEPIVYRPYHSVQELMLYQPMPGEGPDLGRGKAVFEATCGVCHDNAGTGRPGQAPPLVGSEWVVGPPNHLIPIPQLGLNGPIKVKGQEVFFPQGMGPMGANLKDDDLANLLSYIRQAWGNKAAPITPEQVKAVRGEIGARAQAMTADELSKRPAK